MVENENKDTITLVLIPNDGKETEIKISSFRCNSKI